MAETTTKIPSLLKPTIVHRLFGNIVIRCYGTPTDWRTNWPERKSVFRLAQLAEPLGIKSIVSPASDFSGGIGQEVIRGYQFTDCQISLIGPGDGVIMPPGGAVWTASADCATIILHNPINRKIVVAHAGLASLINLEQVEIGGEISNRSVVHQALIALDPDNRSEIRSGIRIFTACSIGREHFDHPANHPEWGRRNLFLIAELERQYPGVISLPIGEGKISLTKLITAQFVEGGGREINVSHDGVDTYGDTIEGSDGLPRWHSHRRNPINKRRNGILVYQIKK